MADGDVAALRRAVAAYAAAVAASDEATERRWAQIDQPIREMAAARALLPLLLDLPERVAAWQRVEEEARFVVDQGNVNATPGEIYDWSELEDALHDLDHAHLGPDAPEREAP